MKKKRLLLLFSVFSLFVPAIFFAQETKNQIGFGELFFTGGLHAILNTATPNRRTAVNDKTFLGSPSPILFSIGVGGNIQILKFLLFSPHLSFYMNYYLWNENRAYTAEIENRTAQVLTFLIDLPLLFAFPVKKSFISVGIGIAIAARYGLTAQGVPKSAQGDTSKINSYFWQAANYLYPSIQLNYDYFLKNGLGFGIGIRYYFPLFNLINKESHFFDASMIAVSARITLPPLKKKPANISNEKEF